MTDTIRAPGTEIADLRKEANGAWMTWLEDGGTICLARAIDAATRYQFAVAEVTVTVELEAVT